MSYPKISIVTPSFNQGKYLEQTILSILNQKYPNLEYIIIDGASTDHSLEIINKYKDRLHYWVSEKDKGQSDAINKGINKATGELFNWINSDDFLEDGALFKIAEVFQKHSEKKIFCFGLNYLYGNKKELFTPQNSPNDQVQCFCAPVISQQATFFTMDAVRKTGDLNLQLHYSMDYEWWLKFMFLFGNKSIFVSPETIASFRIHEEAKTSSGGSNFSNDIASILFSLCNQSENNKYSDLLNNIYPINKKYHFNCNKHTLDAKLIDRMVISFLLKWKHKVYSKDDFLSIKKIVKQVSFDEINLSDKEKKWHKEMTINASPSSWFEFRAKRKLHHLVTGK